EAFRDGHDALMPAFALTYPYPPFTWVEVAESQSEHLAATQAGQRHRVDHGAVAMGPERCSERVDLGWRQHARQSSRRAQEWHPTSAWAQTRLARGQPARNRVGGDTDVVSHDQVRE